MALTASLGVVFTLGLASTAVAMRATEFMEADSADAVNTSTQGGFPALCDASIVADTCLAFNYETSQYFGTDADADLSIVHAAELSQFLMTDRGSILDYLASVGLINQESDTEALAMGAFAVTCAELCEKVKDTLPEKIRPPTSDVGCYVDPESDKVKCTVDVSPGALSGLHFDSDSEGKLGSGSKKRGIAFAPEQDGVDPDPEAELQLLKQMSFPPKSRHQILLSVAKAFRIYPLTNIGAVDLLELGEDRFGELLEESEEVEEEEETQDNDTRAVLLQLGQETNMTCAYYCDLKKYCNPKHKMYRICKDCKQCGGGQKPTSTTKLTKPTIKPTWTKPTTKPSGTEPSSWLQDVLKVAVTAQAYVSQVINKMHSRKVPHVMKKWFGNNLDSFRREVKRVLTSVSNMLDNVDYVRHGDDCGKSDYAYVYPEGPNSKNNKGQFVFYLCEKYFEASLSEKIEILTHEGSHHARAYTDDVCFSGTGSDCKGGSKAYGRSLCEQLAVKSATNALRNADNYCYFINDAFES